MSKTLYVLALVALVALVAATSVNCVQNATVSPSSTPSLVPASQPALTFDDKMGLYNIAVSDPYVKERILNVGWRNVNQSGDQYRITIQYNMGDVTYLPCRESGPDFNRTRVLPAVEIVAGNASEAGINVVAFVDPAQRRVDCIGYVPRQGVKASDSVYSSVSGGLDEYQPQWDMHRSYNNVSIVNTGYIKNMSLPQAEIDKVTQIALSDAGFQKELKGRQARVDNVSVYSYESGYPDRYILAYPMVIIDAVEGGTVYDTLGVLVDGFNGRVVSVRHGETYSYGSL